MIATVTFGTDSGDRASVAREHKNARGMVEMLARLGIACRATEGWGSAPGWEPEPVVVVTMAGVDVDAVADKLRAVATSWGQEAIHVEVYGRAAWLWTYLGSPRPDGSRSIVWTEPNGDPSRTVGARFHAVAV